MVKSSVPELGTTIAQTLDSLGTFDRIQHAAEIESRAGLWLIDAVRAGRGAGMSWDQIGQALGITKQGAWERFARHCDES